MVDSPCDNEIPVCFFFKGDAALHDQYSFPTRRSSDLRSVERALHRTVRHLGGLPGQLQRPELSRKYRSEEHTSELQSRFDLVCRLLLEKKKELSDGKRIGEKRMGEKRVDASPEHGREP